MVQQYGLSALSNKRRRMPEKTKYNHHDDCEKQKNGKNCKCYSSGYWAGMKKRALDSFIHNELAPGARAGPRPL